MEILRREEHKALLGYLTYVKMSLKEWLFVKIQAKETSETSLSIEKIADVVHALFKRREGKLYIENDREILMVIRWGVDVPASIVANDVSKAIPEEGYEISVHEATVEGVAKLEIEISYKKPSKKPTYDNIRRARKQNVILIADDDMYMRFLVKNGLGDNIDAIEVGDGGAVLSTYIEHVPDIMFLDIHMPTLDGETILDQVKSIDPAAYVIMLSADSSPQNVRISIQRGAKGFLTKPFTKEKLHEYLNKCPTIKHNG